MRKKLWRLIMALMLCVICSASAALAQDFQKSYRIGAGGSINIQNVSGDIIINGYEGEAINVRAVKEGPDADQLEVEDRSSGNRVDLRALYPQCRNCSIRASIKFEVQVPRSIKYQISKISTASGDLEISSITADVNASTASGDVLIRDVRGMIKASTASGQMRVKEIAGTINASSASGDVEAEISRLEGTDDLRFSSASGDVRVKVPAQLDAEVHMSSATGDVRTDFPLEVRRQQHGPGASARGRLGQGTRRLSISSASGDVSLTN